MTRHDDQPNLDETLQRLGRSARQSEPPPPAADLAASVLKQVSREPRSLSLPTPPSYRLWTSLAAAAAVLFAVAGYQAWSTLIDPLEQMIELTQFVPV